MKRTIEIEKTYKAPALRAIKNFFKVHPELWYWEEVFEWMLENNKHHLCDDVYNDGAVNKDWRYSLWLYPEEDTTFICIIERE